MFLKKLGLCCLIVIFLILFLTVFATPVEIRENIVEIKPPVNMKWSSGVQTFVLPSMDLNADGKMEKIKLSVFVSNSCTETLSILGTNGQLILRVDFPSDDLCAVINIVQGRKKQIAISKRFWNQPDPCPWFVTIYNWNARGQLVESYFYRTKPKYGLGSPWQELLQNKAHIFSVMDLIVTTVSPKDLVEILRINQKRNQYHPTLKKAKQVKEWVLLEFNIRSLPANVRTDYPNLELWRKTGGKWKNLETFGYMDDPEFLPNRCDIPLQIWWKLFPRSKDYSF